MDDFPSVKAKKLLATLMRKPLEYRVARQKGSHRHLVSDNGYGPVTFSWHDGATIPPRLVEKTLVDDVGLERRDALDLI
jgi:predicted RNA binding protein YcfA (HicA-like mRNA interferase family)